MTPAWPGRATRGAGRLDAGRAATNASCDRRCQVQRFRLRALRRRDAGILVAGVLGQEDGRAASAHAGA
eukprot:1380445-Pyramimonas_sp.AAC.1